MTIDTFSLYLWGLFIPISSTMAILFFTDNMHNKHKQELFGLFSVIWLTFWSITSFTAYQYFHSITLIIHWEKI